MTNIAVIGPESTGKTTIAYQLAKQFNGIVVDEYAREYLEGSLTYSREDVLVIAREQFRRMMATHTVEHVFFDTDLTVIRIWWEQKYGVVPESILKMQHSQPVDGYLLMHPDLPWEPDPLRESEGKLQYLFDAYEKELKRQKANYVVIKGTGSERLVCATEGVRRILKKD